MKKIKMAIITALILIVVLIIIGQVYTAIYEKPEIKTINDFTSIKQAVLYMDSQYIAEQKSEDSDFDKDIFVKFKYDLYENEEYFITFSRIIAVTNGFNSFRLIDEKKEILIAVVCNSKEKVIETRYINGDSNYYGNKNSEKTLKNYKPIKESSLNINSYELISLINNSWGRDANIGTKIDKQDDYEIYDTGIEARFILRKSLQHNFYK